MAKLKEIPLVEIRENIVALRTVDQTTEKWQEFVASIKAVGVTDAINVRAAVDPEGVKYFEIINGLHRYTAAKQVGHTTIPAQILDADDAKVLELQIIGNIQRIDTPPTAYTQQLKRMLSLNPIMTESELAGKLGKNILWVQDRLSLNKITDVAIKNLIDSGKINLSNAYTLAKLPGDEQNDFVAAATTEPANEFSARVSQRVKEINDAKRKGAKETPQVFEPVAHLRKLKDAKEEVDLNCPVAATVCKGMKTVAEGFKLGIQWMMHLDPESVAEQLAKYDAAQAERKERADKRAIEIAKKKRERADIAAKEAANAQAKMEGRKLPHPELEEKQVEAKG